MVGVPLEEGGTGGDGVGGEPGLGAADEGEEGTRLLVDGELRAALPFVDPLDGVA